MKKYLLIFFTSRFFWLAIALCGGGSLFILKAQEIKRTWHWNFGSYEGLDFSSGSPVPIYNSAADSWNGCSSISDTNGNLLCYIGDSANVGGQVIFNRNGIIMPNGHALLACDIAYQDDLIVPQPLNDSIIYVFYVYQDIIIENGEFYYSVINMHLDGGLGDVSKRNIPLLNNYGYSDVAGTKCANDTDLWILTIKQSTDSFYVYKLTPKGLDTNPVISACGLDSNGSSGDIKFSPSGAKLALSATDGYYNEVLNFNDTTGVVYSSNPILFSPPHSQNTDGIEFSPDESKLYWSYYSSIGAGGYNKDLYQANLLAGSISAIEASAILLDSIYTSSPEGLGALQLGPDGKIYLDKVRDHYLGAINYPNKLGKACDYIDSAVDLPYYSFSDTVCFYGLPNFVSSYLYQSKLSEGIKNIAKNSAISVFPNPANTNLYINLTGLNPGPAILSIMDITGRRVLSCEKNISNDIIQVDVSSLPSAMYFLSVKNKDITVTQKFIKY